VTLASLHAPREHGSVLAEPPLDRLGSLLRKNQQRFAETHVQVLGRSLASLRQLARAEALAASRAYLEAGDEPVPAAPAAGSAWVLAGHQPELFHPGVWIKNFALCGLAQQSATVALNIVVDNDLVRSSVLRVPAGRHVAKVAYDHGEGVVPYEERRVRDEALFASLPERVRPLCERWPFTPLLEDFWSEARRVSGRRASLGERFAAARRALERRWGCRPREVPLSALCRTEAFAWFAGRLLDHAPRLHEIYNGALHDYRRRAGIRSTTHPLPDLGREGDWFEVPFWGWRTGDRQRGRLFVRCTRSALELRSSQSAWPTLPCPAAESFVEHWRRLERDGYKIRTRALTTTLFARLCLADLFVHGIGGGKYDELTDVLLERFFGLSSAPAYMVLSATLLLPLAAPPVDADRCRHLAQQARDVWFSPQRFLASATAPAAAHDLMRQKEAWIEAPAATHLERRERCQTLRRLNDELRPYVTAEHERRRRAAHDCREQLEVCAVARRRDYAFCLYPEEMLRDFYHQALSPTRWS
jgi:hypothetical protein